MSDEDESWPASARVARDAINALFAHGPLRSKWIAETVVLCEELQETPPARHAAALFCVRVYGILRDIKQSAEESITFFDEEGRGDEHERVFRELAAELDALYAQVSRTELLWVEYQRDAESHPWLSAYSHKQPAPETVVEARRSGLLRESVRFADYRQAIEATVGEGTVDAAAARLASRLLERLRLIATLAARCAG